MEPVPQAGQSVGVGEDASGDFGQGAVAAGERGDDLDDLFVPDDDSVRIGEYRLEVGVRVGGGGAVAGGDVLLGHAAGDRARAEEADVGDDVGDVARLQSRQKILLAGRLELKQAQRLCVLDELEREVVVEGDLLGVFGASRGADDDGFGEVGTAQAEVLDGVDGAGVGRGGGVGQ
ncbi:hypothetical protein SCNRRL3882_7908 [Streptomyces chartreusis NRRL 3882]|uniref:Uncharacterized protein n=1 Tax=Streptomyces chartreusis NRRL 3882 TaxID=1079985 RepID=A0A2N9BM72_STRCX|nr:hypothetical protein SCNRRL3882_7908 [Streptomyces chartreusis NRRL 3882]